MPQDDRLYDIRYRFITEVNTQVRRLAIVSAIVRHCLARDVVTHGSAAERLFRWSGSQESVIPDYQKVTGRVTVAGAHKPAAASRYFAFAEAVGLILRLPAVYRLGADGSLLLELAGRSAFKLSLEEKLFYLRLILERDADGMITVFDMVRANPEASTKELLEFFHVNLLARLEVKLSYATYEPTRRALLERRAEIRRTWKNPRRYAEHILPPRIHWLADLGLVQGGPHLSGPYRASEAGNTFYEALPEISAQTADIDDKWLDSSFLQATATALAVPATTRPFTDVGRDRWQERWVSILSDAFDRFAGSGAPKAPLRQVILYLTIRLLVDQQVLLETAEMLAILRKEPIIIGNRQLQAVVSAREEESYLMLI